MGSGAREGGWVVVGCRFMWSFACRHVLEERRVRDRVAEGREWVEDFSSERGKRGLEGGYLGGCVHVKSVGVGASGG